MNTNFETLDYIVFALYAIVILSVGLWVSRAKKGETKSTEDYFLASKSLPWWAIGASLIAANISAEQFIGMSGSGFAGGLAIATYEWMAALTLIVVGKFFLPIFIKKKIFPIIKDESESARLAGFGISNPTIQQVFLHKDEIEIGEKILEHLF